MKIYEVNRVPIQGTAHGDSDYTILSTDRYVGLTAISAPRVFTLPAANSVLPGWEVIVADESGSVNTTNTLTITRVAADTIDGASTEIIQSAYGFRRLFSDGTSKWSFDGGIVRLSQTQTISNKRVTQRVVNTTQSATPSINTDVTDVAHITGLAQAITSFTTNLTGTPNPGDSLMINITDNGTARAITWGTSFESSTVSLPTTTVASTRMDIGFIWNEVTSKWRCIGVS